MKRFQIYWGQLSLGLLTIGRASKSSWVKQPTFTTIPFALRIIAARASVTSTLQRLVGSTGQHGGMAGRVMRVMLWQVSLPQVLVVLGSSARAIQAWICSKVSGGPAQAAGEKPNATIPTVSQQFLVQAMSYFHWFIEFAEAMGIQALRSGSSELRIGRADDGPPHN